MMPLVLALSGTDPTGAAGLRLDLETISACGARAAFAVTSIVAQNSRRATAVRPVPADLLTAQIAAVVEEHDVAAVKIGLLGDAEGVRAVAAALDDLDGPPAVLDPVIRASSGSMLLDAAGLEAMMAELLPRVTLITPNAPELSRLTGRPVEDAAGAETAARRLLEQGARSVLVTGGHLDDDPGADLLVVSDGTHRFPAEWIDAGPVRGTGCALSSGVATFLARGIALPEAIARARSFVRAMIRAAEPATAGAARRLEPWRGREVPDAT